MLKFLIIAVLAMVVLAAIVTLIQRFTTFFIVLGILAILGFAAYLYFKHKKKKPAAIVEQSPAFDPEPQKSETVVKTYEVAGVEFYLKNLLSMMEPNYLYSYKKQDLIDTCNYDVPIYKNVSTATRLQLVQEDDNPHDPNAILVLLDDKAVGYIARKDCKHIRYLMDNDLVASFTCNVYGGKYKQVNEDYNWERDRSTYSMETGEDDYGITITIVEKVE